MFKKLSLIFLMAISFGLVSNAQQTIEKRIPMFYESERSFLGIEMEEISKENFAKFGLSEVRGVAVEKVVENSPAAQAGLQKGDVIIKFNGEEISSVRKFMRLISEVSPDHKAKITVLRGGIEQEFTATMGKRPVQTFERVIIPQQGELPMRMPFPIPRGEGTRILRNDGLNNIGQFEIITPDTVFAPRSPRRIGITTNPLTKQLSEYFGVTDGKGILIETVVENSPASRANLRAGDVIVEAEGKPVTNQIDLVKIVNEKKEGEISLTIIRDKQRQTVKITPETIEPKKSNK
jgi:serine protease Do